MKHIFVGVDPGHTGAIAFMEPDETAEPVVRLRMKVHDMPLRRKSGGSSERSELDPNELSRLVSRYQVGRKLLACVELVGARTYVVGGVARGQSAASSFAFGKSAGVIVGVLAALEIPTLEVPPGVWKSALNLSSSKDQSRARASELFGPSSFERKKDDGRAEAALLAYFLWKQVNQ